MRSKTEMKSDRIQNVSDWTSMWRTTGNWQTSVRFKQGRTQQWRQLRLQTESETKAAENYEQRSIPTNVFFQESYISEDHGGLEGFILGFCLIKRWRTQQVGSNVGTPTGCLLALQHCRDEMKRLSRWLSGWLPGLEKDGNTVYCNAAILCDPPPLM